MAAKRGPVTFTVSGQGEFPDDMLRYDRCYPSTGTDAIRMRGRGPRTVTLVSHKSDGKPTEARWASFDWFLVATPDA